MEKCIDPILFKVVENNLISALDEMTMNLIRSAYSLLIKEGADCSSAFYDSSGGCVAQALTSIPLHLGVMPFVIKLFLQKFHQKKLTHGDVLITNDPYSGGNHLPDIIVATPIFYDGELLYFAANMAHHEDIGGIRPRSMPGDAVEILHEGLLIPPTRLCEEGELNEDIVNIILANSRTPEERIGDLQAQIAANVTGERRLKELIKKYGKETVLLYTKELLNYSEKRMKKEIRKIPNGTYKAHDYMDYGSRLLRIQVTIDKSYDNILFDFTGSDRQVRGPVNATFAATMSAVYFIIRAITDQTIPLNDGCYRHVSVVLPEETVVFAKNPVPVSGSTEVALRIADIILKALADVLPEKVCAGSGELGIISFGGIHPETGKLYAFGEALGGGYGAWLNSDGVDATMPTVSNTVDTPAELLEMTFPIRIKSFELIPDSGGAGKWRGGLGFRRDYQLLAPEAVFSLQETRSKVLAHGLFKGKHGKGSVAIYVPEGQTAHTKMLPPYCSITLRKGDVVSIRAPGGGGYGDPLERDPELVLRDVFNRKLSLESARKEYGVVIDITNNKVLLKDTIKLRKKLYSSHRG